MNIKDKSIVILGDSITEGAGASSVNNQFDRVLQRISGAKTVLNYGISGTRIAPKSIPSDKASHDMHFCGRCWMMDKNADIVIIFGGTNDYGHGDAPLGDVNNYDRKTFSGSVHYLCKTTRELYQNSALIFMTPTRCIGDEEPSKSASKPEWAEKTVLVDYVNVIKEIAPLYGFSILDMYNSFPVNPNIKEEYEQFTIDGLHFNDAGHKKIAETINTYLETI